MRKWCAALSSVVLSEGPFGQKFGFNANVFISKIDPSVGTGVELFVENYIHLQALQYLSIQKNAFEVNTR